MKVLPVLAIAAVGSAWVVPDEQVLNELAIEPKETAGSVLDRLPTKDDVLDPIKDAFDRVKKESKAALDDALAWTTETAEAAYESIYETGFDAEGWLESASPFGESFDGPPHHGPPHGKPPHRGPPKHKKPHKPHHGHDSHKPNKTIYQLISESKYTTKLAKLISDDEELVDVLNGTAANYTVFAPTDRAFEKIPKHGKEPSKELIRKVLLYHISGEFYPAGRVLASSTIPTLFNEPHLGTDGFPQRLAVKLGFKGLTLNFYSRVVAINIFATNGVIHGLDSLLVPPPTALTELTLLPQDFSTLTLGLVKTGLFDTINETAHAGGTIFAPPNGAFKKLGPRINGFLFSKFGAKYLKALLEYHVVANQTLYSDAYYDGSKSSDEGVDEMAEIPKKGYFHFDFPTLLKDRSLSVDIGRYGPFLSFKVNGFSRVFVSDGIAKDGVIQAVSDVLIPPRKLATGEVEEWNGEEMELEEFKDRLLPFVDENEHWDL